MSCNNYVRRTAVSGDIAAIKALFCLARDFMAEQGNPQWRDGYPYDDVVQNFVNGGNFRILEIGGKVAAVYSVFDSDGEYDDIKGRWLTDGEDGKTKIILPCTPLPYRRYSAGRDLRKPLSKRRKKRPAQTAKRASVWILT